MEASPDDAMNISRAHRILVIEDEGHVAGFIRDALAEIGYAVTVAAGGADALNKVTDDAPDLVLLDLNLPDMPGFGGPRSVACSIACPAGRDRLRKYRPDDG